MSEKIEKLIEEIWFRETLGIDDYRRFARDVLQLAEEAIRKHRLGIVRSDAEHGFNEGLDDALSAIRELRGS